MAERKKRPRGRPSTKKPVEAPKPEFIKKEIPQQESSVLENRMEENLDNRSMRYKRNPRCPNCDAYPVICRIRRPGYALFQCRQCGHRWEIK